VVFGFLSFYLFQAAQSKKLFDQFPKTGPKNITFDLLSILCAMSTSFMPLRDFIVSGEVTASVLGRVLIF